MIPKQMVAVLLSIHALLVGWIGWGMCPNMTEPGHMAASVYFRHTLRFDVFRVNPPLTRMVTALPDAGISPYEARKRNPLNRRSRPSFHLPGSGVFFNATSGLTRVSATGCLAGRSETVNTGSAIGASCTRQAGPPCGGPFQLQGFLRFCRIA